MKAAIVNPYLDTLGGGERYTMAVATALVKAEYEVDVQWNDPEIKGKLEKRFGIKLDKVNFIEDVNRGDDYEFCFWVSDGSIPNLKARNNLLHFQVPFHGVNGKSIMNRAKMFKIKKVICNSRFTKQVIDKEYRVKSVVVYPPVDISKIKPKRKKENIILYVGRFSDLKQAKGQDILIEAFKKFYKKNKDWRLILAGGVEVGADKYLKKIKKKIGKTPVEILESPDFKVLNNIFGKAKIYWSASGYGINEHENPELVEHFGITVVEAMSAGIVPLVYAAGGHREIIEESVNGFLWKDVDELLSKMDELLSDPRLFKLYKQRVIKSSKRYSYERFEDDIVSLL